MVNLYTPEQVSAAGIYCSVYFDVLELSDANSLFTELLAHSEKWSRGTFYLFDKLAHQGQSTALFTSDSNLQENAPALSGTTKLDSYPYTALLEKAARAVERIVTENVKDVYSHWNANVAVANKYSGRSDSLGWHSDSLSQIGPEPTIAGLSLGCTREFRLKRRSKDGSKAVYSIHAPHNSLIIMHPGCQELFTHTIARAQALTRHPLAGDVRISLTYRSYRKEYQDSALPKCKCECPMILRTTLEEKYDYIWQCGASYSKSGGCGETRRANFRFTRRSVQ